MKKFYTPKEIKKIKTDKEIVKLYKMYKRLYPLVSDNRIFILIGTKVGLTREMVRKVCIKEGLYIVGCTNKLSKIFSNAKIERNSSI